MIMPTSISIFVGVIAIIGAIFIVIGLHEWGHFWMAQRLGVIVKGVYIGLGKPWWSRTSKKGIQYGLSPFLLGGYVKLLDEREGTVPIHLLSMSFTRQPAWKRWLILGTGPLMNFVIAFIFFWVILCIGLPVLTPVVGQVTPHSIAEKAGFQKDDKIVSVGQQAVSSWIPVNLSLIDAFGLKGALSFGVLHANGQKATLSVPLQQWKIDPLKPDLLGSLGISPAYDPKWMSIQQDNPLVAAASSWHYVSSYTYTNAMIIYKISTKILSIRSLAGPISLWTASLESLKKGLMYYVFFLGFLSVSVGFFNLLPIPGLDGFQMILVLVEKIMRRPVSVAMQVLIYQLGMIALALLFVQVVLNDLVRMWTP